MIHVEVEQRYSNEGFAVVLHQKLEELRETIFEVSNDLAEEQAAFPETRFGENTAAALRDLENALGQMLEDIDHMEPEQLVNFGAIIAQVDQRQPTGL